MLAAPRFKRYSVAGRFPSGDIPASLAQAACFSGLGSGGVDAGATGSGHRRSSASKPNRRPLTRFVFCAKFGRSMRSARVLLLPLAGVLAACGSHGREPAVARLMVPLHCVADACREGDLPVVGEAILWQPRRHGVANYRLRGRGVIADSGGGPEAAPRSGQLPYYRGKQSGKGGVRTFPWACSKPAVTSTVARRRRSVKESERARSPRGRQTLAARVPGRQRLAAAN